MKRWFGPGTAERAAVLRGVAVGTGVVIVLTLLLANADAVVGGLLGDSLSSPIWIHLLLSGACTLAFGTASLLSHRPLEDVGERRLPTPRPIEPLMGLGAMALVLAIWVAVQLAVALGGAERLPATAGLTRAQYAREGFFELVAVVAVVLSMLALFGTLLGRPARGRRVPARLLTVMVGGLGVILVAVTFSRLTLYVDAFGLTMLRLSVAWFLGWLTFLVIVVTANISGRRRRPRLAVDRRDRLSRDRDGPVRLVEPGGNRHLDKPRPQQRIRRARRRLPQPARTRCCIRARSERTAIRGRLHR